MRGMLISVKARCKFCGCKPCDCIYKNSYGERVVDAKSERDARAECARVVAGALGCVDYASGWSHGFYCNAGGADGHSCTRVAAAIDALGEGGRT